MATFDWALIGKSIPDAKAYQLDHPDCTVFNKDCKDPLRQGKRIRSNDLLCGDPPCQGFSDMNRFNHQEKAQLNNGLISTALDYCCFYKPRFFILETLGTS